METMSRLRTVANMTTRRESLHNSAYQASHFVTKQANSRGQLEVSLTRILVTE